MSEDTGSFNIPVKFSEDFVTLLARLTEKYGDKILHMNGISSDFLDFTLFSKKFFGKNDKRKVVADVSVDPNANVSEASVTQYPSELVKPILKLNAFYMMHRWVKKLFGEEMAEKAVEKVLNGEIFVNDFYTYPYLPYCYAFDLRTLMSEGMSFYKGNMNIGAPKHSDSFIALLIQSTAYISNQIAGAVSWPDFFVVLDYFYRKEMGDDYANSLKLGMEAETSEDEDFVTDNAMHLKMWSKVKNQFQNFIYSMNFPFRTAQSPFTNISIMDSGFMSALFKDYTYPDFSVPDLGSVKELSKVFFEYFTEINSKEGIFTFPVTTIAVALDDKGEYIDPEFAKWAAEVNSRKALANIFQSTPNSFSSCCRLRNNFSSLADLGYQNSFGVGGLSIGSHRVSGLNLPRLAQLEEINPNIIDEDLEVVHAILFAHRKIIEKRVSDGFLPLYTTHWIDLRRQYSTIGFIGAYEYVYNKGLSILEEPGQDALKVVLRKLEQKALEYQKHDKVIYNIEQIPGESMAVKLAEIDSYLGFNSFKHNLYSNQYVPLIEHTSLFNRIKIQGIFDQYTSGGAILHINVDDEKPIPPEVFFNLMDACRKQKVVYFAINYAYSKCSQGSYFIGKPEKCPYHGDHVVETYTRVVGFITPVKAGWNSVRRDVEFPDRVFYRNGEVSLKH
jgi:ribonucleoside-triphosphate reductase